MKSEGHQLPEQPVRKTENEGVQITTRNGVYFPRPPERSAHIPMEWLEDEIRRGGLIPVTDDNGGRLWLNAAAIVTIRDTRS